MDTFVTEAVRLLLGKGLTGIIIVAASWIIFKFYTRIEELHQLRHNDALEVRDIALKTAIAQETQNELLRRTLEHVASKQS